jgi:molecular chaperone GrpE|tara:strand:- start:262 stop:810 length:549 start_codon:yes stop_codon:yes gene_type:complete
MASTEDDDNKINDPDESINPESEDIQDSEKELSEIEILQKKHDENYDALLRATAEIENIKKRSQKEVENAYKYSTESILQEIIPIYDSLSLSCNLSDEKITKEQLDQGNKLLLSMFQKIFEKNNIEEINPEGESFNPEFHQAISTIENNNEENDKITEVVQKGYLLNNRVIKPALVIVVKNK